MSTSTTEAKGPVTVATTAELRAALEAGHTAQEISIAVVDVEKIRSEAAAAERLRVTGLQAIAMRGFEKEVQAAIENGASVEETAINLTKIAAQRGVTIDQLKAEATAVVPHGGKRGEPDSKGVWKKVAARVNEKNKRLG